MDKLWAPWRSRFIYQKDRKSCIFCHHPRKKQDAKHLIITRRPKAFALLNLYPYNNGHLMVAPYRHARDLGSLTPSEVQGLFMLVRECETLLRRRLRPDGVNIGINLGRTAGAGFRHHIHVHLVPRWEGDTNYMPIVAGTKVISESLEEMYRRLTGAHHRPTRRN